VTTSAPPVVVRIMKGPAYRSVIDTVEALADTAVVYRLERLADMRSLGWWSGDAHTHINHSGGVFTLDPSHARFMGLGEDLHVVNCLDNEYYFTGAPDPVSDDDCIVYMSEEMRSSVFGHLALCGLERLVEPYTSLWWPLLIDIADSARAQGGPAVICAHPVTTGDFGMISGWPGSGLARELPLDAIRGSIDAFELMSYSNMGQEEAVDMWYRLLNCGFRLSPCAGSDAAVNRYGDPPIGGCRVYVRSDAGRPDYYEWLGGVTSGRSFVTNGPLFTEFRVLGGGAGDSINVQTGTYEVFVDVEAVCDRPLDRVDVVSNGRIAGTLRPGADPRRVGGRVSVWVRESCWIAARASGRAAPWFTMGDSLFAHTAPYYIRMDARPPWRRDAIGYFIDWIDSLTALCADQGYWIDADDSARVFAELEAARGWYERRLPTAAGDEEPGGVVPAAPAVTCVPNPFGGSSVIGFTVPRSEAARAGGEPFPPAAVPVCVEILDVSGRLVRRLRCGSMVPGAGEAVWDGTNQRGVPVSSGVYFCRVRAGGRSASAKVVLAR
ncbi:MAG: CehA/McbA family metallohydrolase, partial [Candidatus Krumholzibacteria bacterium]|nr:CehA/McbA family metallohydrolase [Candidatus Krumholzibacteria bacterium]